MENRFKTNQKRNRQNFYTSTVGQFTTVGQHQEQETNNSRIKHIPSHQRFDLSDKLQFVVIFQTIEIERLSTEIQTLRVKLKASQRQIRNYSNYQVQIKQLTQNSFQLEEERINYQNQVEKMSLACNGLYQQLNDAKKQQQKEIDDLKKHHAQVKDQMDRDYQELTDRFVKLGEQIKTKIDNERQIDAKNKSISQQLLRVNQILLQTQNQLTSLSHQQKQKEAQLARKDQEVKNWKQSASFQIQKKDQMLRVLQNQNQQLNQKLNQLTGTAQKLSQDLDRKSEQINQKESQNKDLWLNLSAIYQAVSAQKQRSIQLGKYLQSLRSIIAAKSAEVQKVKDYLTQYHQDMQMSAKRQSQLLATVKSYEKVIAQIEKAKQQIFNLKNVISDKQDKLLSKDKQISDLKFENKEIANKNQILQQNCKRSNKALEQVENNLQNQRLQTQKIKRQKTTLQSQKELLQKQLQTLKAEGLIKENLKRQIQSLKQNCKTQQDNIDNINRRFSHLQADIRTLKQLQEKLKQKQKGNQILRQQLNQSINLNQQLLQSLGSRNRQIDSLIQENDRINTEKMLQSTRSDDFDVKSISPGKNSSFPYSPALAQLSSSRSSLDSNFGRDRFSNSNQVNQKQLTKNTFGSQLNIQRATKSSRSTLGDLSQANKTSISPSFPNRVANIQRQSYLTNRDYRYGDFLKRQKKQP